VGEVGDSHHAEDQGQAGGGHGEDATEQHALHDRPHRSGAFCRVVHARAAAVKASAWDDDVTRVTL
jgi:hypothetical protein